MPKTIDPRNWKESFSNKSYRDNYLKAAQFRNPDWIPCSLGFFEVVWAKYREKLTELVMRHPFVFGTITKYRRNYDHLSERHQANSYHVDHWGCGWQTAMGGMEGQVVTHPLADWSALETYKFPDPKKYTEWGKHSWFFEKFGLRSSRKLGYLTAGGGERLFDRLYFLRGFDNLMKDIARNDPHLPILIQRLTDHELFLVRKYIDIGVDQMNFHTDIGTQDRLMMSPRQFQKYIKPMYSNIFQPLRKADILVYLSSDGNLLEIVDDLIECGVSIHDPQFRANGLEGIAKHYKGKMCIDLDLDRQSFPFASPETLKAQIRDAVDILAMPEGGLMMKAEISDANVPLENIEAIAEAFEEYCIPRK